MSLSRISLKLRTIFKSISEPWYIGLGLKWAQRRKLVLIKSNWVFCTLRSCSRVALAPLYILHIATIQMKWVSEWIATDVSPGNWTGTWPRTGDGHGTHWTLTLRVLCAPSRCQAPSTGATELSLVRSALWLKCWLARRTWAKGGCRGQQSKQLKCRLVGSRFFRAHCTSKCCCTLMPSDRPHNHPSLGGWCMVGQFADMQWTLGLTWRNWCGKCWVCGSCRDFFLFLPLPLTTRQKWKG